MATAIATDLFSLLTLQGDDKKKQLASVWAQHRAGIHPKPLPLPRVQVDSTNISHWPQVDALHKDAALNGTKGITLPGLATSVLACAYSSSIDDLFISGPCSAFKRWGISLAPCTALMHG